MRRTLALIFVVVLAPIAEADDKPTAVPSKQAALAPENDSRLAKLNDAQPNKIGVLTYFPNKGGGYTFLEGKQIAFYALPCLPTTYKVEGRVMVCKDAGNGDTEMVYIPRTFDVPTIGPSAIPFGGQTVFRSEVFKNGNGGLFREDIRLAYWSRDTSEGDFHLWILTDDRETRLKLKSIVPVLEHASKP